jgi:hypothetical protein
MVVAQEHTVINLNMNLMKKVLSLSIFLLSVMNVMGQENQKPVFKSKEFDNSFYLYLMKDLKFSSDTCFNKEVTIHIDIKANKVDSITVFGILPQPIGEILDKKIRATDGYWNLDKDYTVVLIVIFRFRNGCNRDQIELSSVLYAYMMNLNNTIYTYDNFLRGENQLIAVPLTFDDEIKR